MFSVQKFFETEIRKLIEEFRLVLIGHECSSIKWLERIFGFFCRKREVFHRLILNGLLILGSTEDVLLVLLIS